MTPGVPAEAPGFLGSVHLSMGQINCRKRAETPQSECLASCSTLHANLPRICWNVWLLHMVARLKGGKAGRGPLPYRNSLFPRSRAFWTRTPLYEGSRIGLGACLYLLQRSKSLRNARGRDAMRVGLNRWKQRVVEVRKKQNTKWIAAKWEKKEKLCSRRFF